jgi:hypothetical protein
VNLPVTDDGVACLAAVEAAVGGGGMAGISVDIGGALALAAAHGVPAAVAAELVPAAALGVTLGISDRRGRDE